jgi:anti-anti-sigma regulatory factor
MDAVLDITVRRHGQVVIVHPRGVLTSRTATRLRQVLVRELLNRGQVVVDLDRFQLGQASWTEIFPAALAECGGWPAAKVALCRPDKEMAQALAARGISSLVPVYHLLLEAEGAIDRRPDVVRTQTRLPCDMGASAAARQLVREMCPLWQVDDELPDTAQVVVSELVGIAVGPVGASAGLTLERGPRGLRVAVRDVHPSDFSRHEERSTDELGLGVEMLGNLTTAWGVDIQAGGKIAWTEMAQ